MAEEKKDTFPWIQLIATVGTILAALIGITPYILKLNTASAPQTPTIVILTLPPAATTPVPVTTQPVTPVETTPVLTQTTVVTTIPTTGPPLTPVANETANVTATSTVPTTMPATTIPATTPATTAPVPTIQISVNATSVPQGGFILASGSTDAAVPQVTITLANSTTFQSAAVPVTLSQGAFQFQVDTSAYAPGDYTISAAVPDTTAIASAFFAITAA